MCKKKNMTKLPLQLPPPKEKKNQKKNPNTECILLKKSKTYLEGGQLKNTRDPNEMAEYEPSHLGLKCLQIQLLLCLAP